MNQNVQIIIRLENIYYTIENGGSNSSLLSTEILQNISIKIDRGSIVGIAGQSGSGKTSLAKILSGIILPSRGKIIFSLSESRKKDSPNQVQILFQNDGELLNPYRKVKDILNEAFEQKFNKKDDYTNNILETFNLFGLKNELLEKKGFQLSGGEQQRIALGRIIITEPEVLILDEPFSAQDVESQLNILGLIKKLKEKFNLTVIVISHDLNLLKHLCQDLIIMQKGKIVESGKASEVLSNPKDEYTKILLSAKSLQLSNADIESFSLSYEQN